MSRFTFRFAMSTQLMCSDVNACIYKVANELSNRGLVNYVHWSSNPNDVCNPTSIDIEGKNYAVELDFINGVLCLIAEE